MADSTQTDDGLRARDSSQEQEVPDNTTKSHDAPLAAVISAEASKKPVRQKAYAVFITAPQKPTAGLSILVRMPFDEAKRLVELLERSKRKESAARGAILKALAGIERRQRRSRDGLLQGNIPSELKNAIQTLARSQQNDVSDLLRDRLHEWIDPGTGNRRKKIVAGVSGRAGPIDYREYVRSSADIYARARMAGSLKRLQVEVGEGVAERVEHLVGKAQVTMGEFLAALVRDIIDSNAKSVL